MKTRTLKELYKLVLDKLKDSNSSYYICNIIDSLYRRHKITIKEREKLVNHFSKQFPTKNLYPEIYNNELFSHRKDVWFDSKTLNDYPSDSSFREIRIKLINLIIDRLESCKI